MQKVAYNEVVRRSKQKVPQKGKCKVKNDPKITIEQLRALLFSLDNQEMTVRELRSKLFDVVKQEKVIENDSYFWWRIGVQK